MKRAKWMWTGALVATQLMTAQLGCAPTPEAPVYKPGACGQAAYEWQAKDKVGTVVSVEELTDFAVTADVAELLAAGAGLGDFLPLRWGSRLFRMRYTTQDRGRLVEATGLVAVPTREEAADRALPLMAYLHGTTGLAGFCAPSHPDSVEDTATLMGAVSAMGYIMVAPDYIGLDPAIPQGQEADPPHSYLVAEQAAIGSLDMMRAVKTWLQTADLGPTASETNILFGGSQGGHAVFATERLGPHYAPELPFKAAIALVPPSDLVSLSSMGVNTLGPTTLAVAPALLAMDRWYANGENLSDMIANEAPNHVLDTLQTSIANDCRANALLDLIDEPKDLFTAAFGEKLGTGNLDDLGPAACYLRENSFATTSVPRASDTPFFYVVSGDDQLVLPASQRPDFEKLCSQGYKMDYLECAGASHTKGAVWSLKEQFTWLRARLKDEALPATNCQLSAATKCSGEGL